VLATHFVPPWRVLWWVKFIEAVMQLRPRALWRALAHPDLSFRKAMQWYYRIGRRVWPYELWKFIMDDRRLKNGPRLAEFWAAPVDETEPAPPDRSAPVAVGGIADPAYRIRVSGPR